MTKKLELNLSQLAYRISAHDEKQIIILAGADRVGKTTFSNKLLNELSKYQSTAFEHFSAPDKERQRQFVYRIVQVEEVLGPRYLDG